MGLKVTHLSCAWASIIRNKEAVVLATRSGVGVEVGGAETFPVNPECVCGVPWLSGLMTRPRCAPPPRKRASLGIVT